MFCLVEVVNLSVEMLWMESRTQKGNPYLGISVCVLQPENSLPGRCLYDLVAVVVHHGSG